MRQNPDMAEVPLLKQAWNLYRQGRFALAVEKLEPQIFRYREDAAFFRLLGLSCLRLGDWKGGGTYLQRAHQLEPEGHRDTLMGLMAYSAWKREFSDAVRWGLIVLDRDPQDRMAKKALARLRIALAESESPRAIEKETLGRWLPPFRRSISWWPSWATKTVAGVVIASGLGVGSWLGFQWASATSETPGRAVPTTSWQLPTGNPILSGPGVLLTLTGDEVKATWKRAQEAFQAYQDSRARYEINRILLSNASPAIKNQARVLIPFLHEPDFARPEDSSNYQDIRQAPRLYEGCTVRWVGVLANLIAGETKITFDLLLGYETGQVVEGVVPVELNFAALLKNSQVVEVLGRVALRGDSWFIEGTSLHTVGYRAP